MRDAIQVLHVDDEPEFADLTATYLERENNRLAVETTNSSADGLDRLSDGIDCVVADYDMPGMNGIEFLESVREEYPDLPFILFTGKGSEEIASDAISAGVTDYLQKESGPDQYAVLANRVTNAVAQSWAEHQLQEERQRFQILFERLTQPTVEVEYQEDEPIVQQVNPAFEDVFGYDASELVGSSLDDYILSEGQEGEASQINQRVQAGGGLDSLEVTRRTADGNREFLLQNAVYDDGSGGFAIYTDITDRKEREQQLERQNGRLTAIFENFPEPTLAYTYENGEPQIRQVNEAFTETFGYEAEEAVGAEVDSLLVPPGRQTEAARIDDRVRTGDSVDEILQRQTKEGIREFRFRNILLPDDEAFDGYAIYADVTERRQRERDLERKERIIQEMKDGVVVIQDKTITYTNPQISEIVGYPAEVLVGKSMTQFIAPEDREKVRRRYEERLAGTNPPKTYEISLLRRDGGTVPVEITAGRVSYGGDAATLSIVRDITDRKERIRELERQNERLEEFASIVSHDLRNPLNVAMARLELARDTCDSPHLVDIADAHDRMEWLIDDLLTLARQGETVREMNEVSLGTLVEDCWAGVETAGTTLDVETDATIRADRGRLQQAIENLVRNAVEHGGSDVTVRVGALANRAGFYVADDGQGIPEDTNDSVFESGYSTADDGTGLGLAIVREIVEAHGWEIGVSDSESGGARFEITGVGLVD
jgi:PAS domain S-box-containing protein